MNNNRKKITRKRCNNEPRCTNYSRGATSKCITHGGGKRCDELRCNKGAAGKTSKCKGHGGGNRCDEPGCTNYARGTIGKCITHVEGKRCDKPGCTNSAKGTTSKCKGHAATTNMVVPFVFKHAWKCHCSRRRISMLIGCSCNTNSWRCSLCPMKSFRYRSWAIQHVQSVHSEHLSMCLLELSYHDFNRMVWFLSIPKNETA